MRRGWLAGPVVVAAAGLARGGDGLGSRSRARATRRAPRVACRPPAQKGFAQAKILLGPLPLGAAVKAVPPAVELGQVDAGVVYKPDVRAAGAKVRGIAVPAGQNASTSSPIAVLPRAPN